MHFASVLFLCKTEQKQGFCLTENIRKAFMFDIDEFLLKIKKNRNKYSEKRSKKFTEFSWRIKERI